MNIIRSVFIGITVALSVTNANATNLVVNGSFEDNTIVNVGSFDNLSSGLIGWSIGAGNVDLVSNNYWAAYQGDNSLDLNGTKKAEIEQTLVTTVGQLYQLSFWLAGNPQGGSTVKNLSVNVGANGLYNFDTSGKSTTNMGWSNYITSFYAVGNTTTLSFASNTRGAYGPVLDDISVTAVPEPETYALLLGGLALVGFSARKQSKKSKC
jgi:choice-of-anchor C domain-containing protein